MARPSIILRLAGLSTSPARLTLGSGVGGREMPYQKKRELPKSVRDTLPAGAQEIFRKAYNNA
jgi:ChaB